MNQDDLTVQLCNFISDQRKQSSELMAQAEELRKKARAHEDAAFKARDLLSITCYSDIVREQLDHIQKRLSDK